MTSLLHQDCLTGRRTPLWHPKILHDTLLYFLTETTKAKEAVLPWTSRGKCPGSPLGAQSMKGSEVPREAALITKTWASFLEQTTVFFWVIIDQALLCWVRSQPALTRSGSRWSLLPPGHRCWGTWGESVEAPALPFKSHVRQGKWTAGLWRLAYINSHFKGKCVPPPTEFSCFKSTLISFKLIFVRPGEYI